MSGTCSKLVVATVVVATLPGFTAATTRNIADYQPARLTFGQSILNQLTYDTYRDPFDELQTRPYNLLFNNIGRHPNLSPWQGQEGNYTRYFNALIGNNGAANVDNEADAIQGALIRRETARIAWGVSGAYLAGDDNSADAVGTTTFADGDTLGGYDVRGAAALKLSDRRVLGAGVQLTQAGNDVTDGSFEEAVGGFYGADEFAQQAVAVDVGVRQFRDSGSSFEGKVVVGYGTVTQDSFSEDLDATGAVTDRFVITNYDINDLSVGAELGYNRLKRRRIGETEFRVGIAQSQRELDNSDLAYSEDATGVTPSSTLLGQDTITTTRVYASAKSIFQAGETEMFAGAELGHSFTDGATQVDAAGTIVNESIDDTRTHVGLTVGVRQPLYRDKVRFIVSGRADVLSQEQSTVFDTSSESEDSSVSTAQYAIGLEGVLANVTFDIAWLLGEEAPVVPVPLGLPGGSRRSVEVDRLVFSAAVAW